MLFFDIMEFMKRGFGLIYIVIFVIFLLGGIFVWQQYSSKQPSVQKTELYPSQDPKTENPASETEAHSNQKNSDSPDASKNQNAQIPLKAQKIAGLEIPLCPKNALTITAQNSHGVLDTPEKEDSHQIISHAGYTLCYREKFEQPEWVSYTLDRAKTEKAVTRNDNFRPDPEVITGSAALSDYKKSGFDRGHMAPSTDMTYSELTMDESFYLSNMSPQTGDLNRGLWKELEHHIRTLTETFDILYIVTGPVLEKDDYATIGSNEVAVPEFYYKAICGIKNENWFAIGFILPNKKCSGGIFDYAVSIDEIENRTGLDFFSLLEDETEVIIEKEVNIYEWK